MRCEATKTGSSCKSIKLCKYKSIMSWRKDREVVAWIKKRKGLDIPRRVAKRIIIQRMVDYQPYFAGNLATAPHPYCLYFCAGALTKRASVVSTGSSSATTRADSQDPHVFMCYGSRRTVERAGIVELVGAGEALLYTPQPTEDIRRHDGDTSSRCDSGERLLRAGFTVREAIAADHDGDQARDLGHSAGEECLKGSEASVEGTTLGMSCKRHDKKKSKN